MTKGKKNSIFLISFFKKNREYWTLVMDVARRNNLKRILRCSQIMGKRRRFFRVFDFFSLFTGPPPPPPLPPVQNPTKLTAFFPLFNTQQQQQQLHSGRAESDDLSAAQIFYPCMQCADIFFLKADICQLGMDQRKVNVLAREYCDSIKKKLKPIILSHAMLPGLLEGQEKMSKSDPNSAIFMEDSRAEVETKIKKAFCPPGVVEGNPCLSYCRFIVFPWFGQMDVEKGAKSGGGTVSFEKFEDLAAAFASGELHPGDLKPALAKSITALLQPVRDHFEKDERAAALLKKVKGFKVTK